MTAAHEPGGLTPKHRNAPLTPEGRLRLCHRIAAGWSITATDESMQISRQTASKWWGSYTDERIQGVRDHTRGPRHSPRQTPAALERRILGLRAVRKLGPAIRIRGLLV